MKTFTYQKAIVSKFEIGKTYLTLRTGSTEHYTIATRTAKTITTTDGKRFGIHVWEGVEQFMPWGRYSMAPVVNADRVQA